MSVRGALICEGLEETVRSLSWCGQVHGPDDRSCHACLYGANLLHSDFLGSVAACYPDMTISELALEMRALARAKLQ